MAEIPVSGHNDEAFTVPGTDVRELISGLDPDGDGRVFYLREAIFANEHATQVGVVELYDQDEAAATAGNQRGAAIHVPPADTVIIKFDPPLPFVTNCTVGVTNGTFATLSQFGAGVLR
jgi:hypothetical protein